MNIIFNEENKDYKKEKPDFKPKSGFVCPNCGSTSSLTSNSSIGCSYCSFTYPKYFEP